MCRIAMDEQTLHFTIPTLEDYEVAAVYRRIVRFDLGWFSIREGL